MPRRTNPHGYAPPLSLADLNPPTVQHICAHLGEQQPPRGVEHSRWAIGTTLVLVYRYSATITGTDPAALAATETLIRQHVAWAADPDACPHRWPGTCRLCGATICTLCGRHLAACREDTP